jgi:NAD(P)-dependent dehydrogenase (short-subunit alcohol dehydrogenase family)
MTYFIYARDGAGLVVLRRDTEEAAQRRAAELKDMGWFDIDITEEDDGVASESAVRKAAGAPHSWDLRARG